MLGMEIIIILIILAVLLASDRAMNKPKRSRYDPIPKPPVSITRSYKGELGEAIDEFEYLTRYKAAKKK